MFSKRPYPDRQVTELEKPRTDSNMDRALKTTLLKVRSQTMSLQTMRVCSTVTLLDGSLGELRKHYCGLLATASSH